MLKISLLARLRKLHFGARGMSIKKNIPARQKSFLARMGGVLKRSKGQKTFHPLSGQSEHGKKTFLCNVQDIR